MQSLLEFMNRDRLKKYKAYNYFPKSNKELKEIVKKLIKERGKEADLNDIDVSQINDFSHVFEDLTFNGDISNWDVSNATTMKAMFYATRDFTGKNTDFSGWDVSKVKDMGIMFTYTQFNGNISEWNTKSVTTMGGMFMGSEFDQNISGWNVENVTNIGNMFRNSSFDKNLEKWHFKNKPNMDYAFAGCCAKVNNKLPSWYNG